MNTGRTKLKTNLNEIKIIDARLRNDSTLDQKDFSVREPQKCNVTVYFKNLRNNLIREIDKCDAVVGCVAWLTDYEVLDHLGMKKNVSIIVNKEDFLRPDICSPFNFKYIIREKYSRLKNEIYRCYYDDDSLVSHLSCSSDPTIQPIRCVGIKGGRMDPKMHHKFLVFCSEIKSNEDDDGSGYNSSLQPYAVWSGSFNLTYNSNFSFENAILIYDEKIAKQYYKEWGQLMALSEPLDWDSEYVDPEWRIGT